MTLTFSILIFLSVASNSTAISALGILSASAIVFKLVNRFEAAIAALFVGVTVYGYIGGMVGIPWLGKLIGLISILALKDSIPSLLKNKKTLIAILLCLLLCLFFYALGPQTNTAQTKLVELAYYALIYAVLFNAFFFYSEKISFRNISLCIAWFVASYTCAGINLELFKSGIDPIQISGIRSAITQINLDNVVYSGSIAEGASQFSYQLIGNYSALSLIFLSMHILTARKIYSSHVILALILFWLLLLSGARQSLFIYLISVASLWLVRHNVNKNRLFALFTTSTLLVLAITFYSAAKNIGAFSQIFTSKTLAGAINRDTNFNAGIELIQLKPFFGHGFGGFYIPELGTLPGEFRLFPHNLVLELWSELGLIGMLLFFMIWLLTYRSIYSKSITKAIISTPFNRRYSVAPLFLFYMIGAMTNEILTKSIALFILMAYFLYAARAYERNQNT